MVFDVSKISGVGEYSKKHEKARTLYFRGEKVFFVENKATIELRTDRQLAKTLCERYESVMESRFFGRGGIEIVPSSQLEASELEDLIRLSYALSE